jgi:hypothetical protein
MSTAGDIFSIVKKIILVSEDLDRLSSETRALSDDVRDHEARLIRIETTLDFASKRSRLILPGE